MPIEMIEEDLFELGTKIKVIGVGGGGGNAVDHMISEGVQGVEFICANTDAQALRRSKAGELIQLGKTGLGAGSKPQVGKAAAEEAEGRIREALAGSHMVFLAAGMGGGTGTGAAPVIARIAKEMGVLTVGVVTKPFEFEGGRRMKQAEQGLSELEANVDSLIVILNEKLIEVLGDDISQDQAFKQANDVLKNAVGGIADIIHIDASINVDFEDVRTVMSEPGKAMMGTAVATGPDRANKAADAAVACPLLEGIDLSGARGVLVLIAASKSSLKLSESKNAMNTIRRYASEEAHVIFGAAHDDSLGDQLRVTVIATGLAPQRGVLRPAHGGHQPHAQQHPPIAVVHSQPLQRTGTDNLPVLNHPVVHASQVQPQVVMPAQPVNSYAGMDVPSVWRNGRTQAAAKVDALASNGMDEIDIPAFLRRQAD
ncbi:MAG TPA: cell division protein FtsZ [Methylibium sp.]|uniref:cell division protein FtsZ n=1 Tax=Methylibium sp. TaxID=2067992 RepID=UPI002DB61CB5|nr:cell division protein FtsZ [Methylibium sp.]HEU4458294.1 cell division protein FtsZ [Methylibium sp.]